MINQKMARTLVIGVLALTFSINKNTSYAAVVPNGLNIENVSVEGLSADEAKDAIDSYIDEVSSKNIILNVADKKAEVSLKELGYSWDNKKAIEDAIDEYTSGNILKRYAKSIGLETSPVTLDAGDGLDDTKLNSFLENECAEFTATAADAAITRENGKFVITPSVDGIKIDEAATKQAIVDSLATAADAINVTAAVTVDKPKVSSEDLESIKDELGTYTTDYSSSSSGRATNIDVGCAKINGHVLMPGETLSGYECLQPFTIENGYKIAAAYENGQVVDSVGGGACQLATTLYNAALRAELEITQRQNHSMIVSYVPASADAAIAGTYKDIKITNNQDTPIYIEGRAEGRKLTFTIWGKETRASNRTVEFESEILSSTPAGVTEQPDPTLPAGQTVQVSSGHNGRKSRLWKIVKVDGVETERSIVSTDTYITSNSVVRVGTAVAAPVEETVPETAAAEEVTAPAIVEGLNGGPGVTSPEQ